MDDSELKTYPTRRPTADRPLLGLTVLVVEDSRYASEAMRLLCLRSGARIRRADCLRAARRHLQVYRPSAVVVDLGLPDGSGLDLIAELNAAQPRVALIFGTSADDTAGARVRAAGADGFLAKPVTSLAGFQQALLSLLPPDQRPMGPRAIDDDAVRPDPLALQDDLAHAAEVLNDSTEGKALDYVAQFVGGLAQSAQDAALAEAAAGLARARATGRPVATDAARIAGMIHQRLQDRRAI